MSSLFRAALDKGILTPVNGSLVGFGPALYTWHKVIGKHPEGTQVNLLVFVFGPVEHGCKYTSMVIAFVTSCDVP